MKIMIHCLVSFLFTAILIAPVYAQVYDKIVIPEPSHPAVKSAAQIIAKKLSLPESAIQTRRDPAIPVPREIVLVCAPGTPAQMKLLHSAQTNIKHDGYAIGFQEGGVLIYGVRPRSLLFAAGDLHLWKDRTSGTYVRDPFFAIRTASYQGRRPVDECVAALGINLMVSRREATITFKETLPEVYRQLTPEEQTRLDPQSHSASEAAARLARECRDADVDYYPFIYGNDFSRWSPTLYAAVLKAYPSTQGKPAPASWEKATLCPSDPMTWKVIEAYIREFAQQQQGEGLCVTFWDRYGLNCQCDRCVKNGLNKFPNQLYECVKHYHDALASIGKKLIVRTWSSGVPHWLGEQWVHAPGYDNFGGSGADLWSRVIKELPSDIVIQTKVYHADCQPDTRFSTLLGLAGPHTEIAEYQLAGQTTGRYYFPAATVNHSAWTMKKAYGLVGDRGGVHISSGGTEQTNYDLLDDIANSINVYAWRELSWEVNKDTDTIWMEWAVPIFGEKAAPHIIKALKLSEEVVNRLFSVLGLGSDTNSGFASNIQRRETLLKYTNRYFLPEGVNALVPTKENIQRVIDEKNDCMKKLDEMFHELELAKPFLRPEQAQELATRLDWLKEFAVVNRNLDESLWRYRYLRYEASLLTTDPEQMKYLAAAYDTVKEHQSRLFRFDPHQKFSCYSVPLGQLARRPSLGNPVPLMKELYDESRALVEGAVGPDYLPAEWKRP
jgi:hypothetical protein